MADPDLLRLQPLFVAYVSRRRAPRVGEVAAALRVKPEVVRRLVERLSMCGLPPFSPSDLLDIYIEYPDTIRLRIPESARASLERPLRLTPDEVEVLAVALRESAEGPDGVEARTAMEKMSAALAAAGVAPPDDPSSTELAIVPGEDESMDHIRLLQRARDEGRVAQIEYYSAKSDTLSVRRFRTHGVFANFGPWYAVCIEEDADGNALGEKSLKLSRVRDVRLLEDRFDKPASFDPRSYLAANMFTGRDSAPVARVRLTPALARRLRDENAGPIELLADGAGILTIPFSGVARMATWVLAFGGAAVVIEPEELRQAVVKAADAALARYGEG